MCSFLFKRSTAAAFLVGTNLIEMLGLIEQDSTVIGALRFTAFFARLAIIPPQLARSFRIFAFTQVQLPELNFHQPQVEQSSGRSCLQVARPEGVASNHDWWEAS